MLAFLDFRLNGKSQHLEEAYRVAELLFPRLPLYQPPSINSNYELQPFGEGFGPISQPKSIISASGS